VNYHTHIRSDWPIKSQPKTDTALYVLTTRFTQPSIPRRVWWFDATTTVEAEDDPTDEQVFPYDAAGSIAMSSGV
jgi:hypothetical protein